MKIEAYACQHCESIYKTQQKATACEKKCLKQKQEDVEEQERLANLETLVHYVRLNAESVEEVCRMSEEVSLKLFPKSSIKKMTLRVGYNPHGSNTHSCPIGGVSNFSPRQNPDKPTGYPALTGNIKVVYNKEPKGFSSDTFNGRNGIAGIHTGSGGYRSNDGGYTVEYGVTLWLSDFPKLKEKLEQQIKINENFEDLKLTLYGQYTEEVENDSEIATIGGEVRELYEQIAKLQQEVRLKDNKISSIKKEKYGGSKQLILDAEYVKTENSFGIKRAGSNLTGCYQ